MRRETTQLFSRAVRESTRDFLKDHEEQRYDTSDIKSLVFRCRLPNDVWSFLAYFTHPSSECFTAECALSSDGEFPFDQDLRRPQSIAELNLGQQQSDRVGGLTYRFRLVHFWSPQDHWFCVGAAAWRTAKLPFMAELIALLQNHAPSLPNTNQVIETEVKCTIGAYRDVAVPFMQKLIEMPR